MKRRHVVLLLLTLLLPIYSFAISLSELQNDSDRFVNVAESPDFTTYVDVDSIASLRYAPPYYTMQGDVYIVDYSENIITFRTVTVNYDYNRSIESMFKTAYQHYPGSDDKASEEVCDELMKDIGITTGEGNTSVWMLDGTFVDTFSLNHGDKKVGFASPYYYAANYMFYKGYDMYFNLNTSPKQIMK